MDINKIKKQLIKHEGLSLKPYHCTAGKLTIGVGHNLDDNGITEEMADFILEKDISQVIGELTSYVKGFEDMPSMIQEVLVDMGFNLGITRLLTFKRFFSALAKQNYRDAAREMMDSRWAAQVGSRAENLRNIVLDVSKDRENEINLKQKISELEARIFDLENK